MDKTRYKEIAKRNLNSNMMLCYEVFCEEKGKITLQQFQESLPHWIMMQQPDVFVRGGGNLNHCTEVGLNKIVDYLNKKYK